MSFLRKPITHKEQASATGTGVFSNVSFALSSMQGWRVTQEDAHCHMFPSKKNANLGFVGVFDGHAGGKASAWISHHVLNFIENSDSFRFIDRNNTDIDPVVLARACMEGFFDSDASLMQIPEFQSGKEVSGCTGVVCILTRKNIVVGNTGDSRCVLVRGGVPIFATRDHKPTDERETERVRAAGGTVTYGRINGDLASARSFGDFRYKRDGNLPASQQIVTVMPDIAMLDRDPLDQILILACDGIWDVMSNLECASFVLAALKLGASEQKAGDLVLDECLKKSSGDNMSIIIVTLNEGPLSRGTPNPNVTIDDVRDLMYKDAL